MATPARSKLSLVRLLILVLAVVGLGAAGWTQGSEAYRRITANPAVTWFAPYDDVTLTPTYHFEDLVVSPSLAQVLGFVVADPSTGCAPTWGTYYDLDGAGRALDLDRVKKVLRSPVVIDLRNIYRPAELAAKGLSYVSVGRAADASHHRP